jgi:hypothetical protein
MYSVQLSRQIAKAFEKIEHYRPDQEQQIAAARADVVSVGDGSESTLEKLKSETRSFLKI